MKTNSYYNTLGHSGQTLIEFESKAKKQDLQILEIFKFKNTPLTPCDVETILNTGGIFYPLTSIRRSITNLTKEGRLRCTGNHKVGKYGRPNNTWIINN